MRQIHKVMCTSNTLVTVKSSLQCTMILLSQGSFLEFWFKLYSRLFALVVLFILRCMNYVLHTLKQQLNIIRRVQSNFKPTLCHILYHIWSRYVYAYLRHNSLNNKPHLTPDKSREIEAWGKKNKNSLFQAILCYANFKS